MRRTFRTTLGRAVLAGAMLLGFLAVTSQTVSATTPPNYYVTTTGGSTGTYNCHNFLAAHACSLIRALSLATANAVIHLKAGTYYDTPSNVACPWTSPGIDVNYNNLTIKGPAVWPPTAIIEPCSTLPEPGIEDTTQQNVLVNVAPGITGAVLSHVTIDGSDAQNSFTACTDDYVGVYFGNSSGHLNDDIVKNVQQPPASFGCHPGADGDVYAVSCVSSCPSTSGTSTVAMDHVDATGYDKNGITCDGPATDCTIAATTVLGVGPSNLIAENGIQIAYGAKAAIAQSTIEGNSDPSGAAAATGILPFEDSGVTATHNVITDNDINVGPTLDGVGNGLVIADNTISNATDASLGAGQGILDYGTLTATIEGNSIINNAGGGVAPYGSDNSTISTNTILNNTAGGVIDLGATGTSILGNTIKNNSAGGVIGVAAAGEVVGAAGSGNIISNNAGGNVIELQMTSCTIVGNTFAGTGGYIWEHPNPDCSTPTGNSPSAANTPAPYTGPASPLSPLNVSPSS
jgi:parallel beta-helix repeat protein